MTDDHLRDEQFDELLTPGDEPLAAFLGHVRTAYPPDEPAVGPQLAAVFAEGLGAAAAPAPGGAARVATPKRRRLDEGFGLRRIRAALTTGAALIGLSGLGGANLLPGPLQAAFDSAVGAVGIERPGSARGDGHSPAVELGPAVGHPGSSSSVGRTGEGPDRRASGAAPSQPGTPSVGPGGGVGGDNVRGAPGPGGGTQLGVPAPGAQACVPVEDAPPPPSTTAPASIPATPLPGPGGVPEPGAPPPPACPAGTVPVPTPPSTPTVPPLPGPGAGALSQSAPPPPTP